MRREYPDLDGLFPVAIVVEVWRHPDGDMVTVDMVLQDMPRSAKTPKRPPFRLSMRREDAVDIAAYRRIVLDWWGFLPALPPVGWWREEMEKAIEAAPSTVVGYPRR
ncbi:hypothetical protein NKI09_07105 [Mesorhizobium sp. M0757]|uniref:hypothetical protein n=1 Tax=Mesorhizobium sp. M0757 TaxID=2956993 RepID=UPI00333D3850